ncbi:PRC-barrel domain-containing protein [Psychromarinibacter sp. C21-152]|uniref:PRC-barrel domain-containing protein n=1 Tax=Psychromarinibacter sediminicola TaxID=3033385 RepID=A0AAE3T9U7_9RHOB|nr:PRC-barrel domain-containing protein [Psychromarinibacter sediminicola]MDF0600910.1 PRC-barrel domain-containing protein [Psychromarinibacter sediminicola]
MYRTTLIATAFLAAAPAAAQESDTEAMAETDPTTETTTETTGDAAADTAPPMAPEGTMIRADAVADAVVYTLADTYDEAFWDSGQPFKPVVSGWAEIGAVEDIVLDDRAEVVGVTVDVGGFLGIGDSTVLLPVDDIRLVQMPDDEDFLIVTRLSREQIENAEEVEDQLLGDD